MTPTDCEPLARSRTLFVVAEKPLGPLLVFAVPNKIVDAAIQVDL